MPKYMSIQDVDKMIVEISQEDEAVSVQGKNIIIAVGSNPSIPGFLKGIKNIVTSEEFWGYNDIPKDIAVIGGGVIGCEYSASLAELGYNVSLIEMEERLLTLEDDDISQAIFLALTRAGVDVNLSSRLEEVKQEHNSIKLILSDKKEIKNPFDITVAETLETLEIN